MVKFNLVKQVVWIISGASFIDNYKPLFMNLRIQTVISKYLYISSGLINNQTQGGADGLSDF